MEDNIKMREQNKKSNELIKLFGGLSLYEKNI